MCVMTDDVLEPVGFYQEVLGIELDTRGDGYAEFSTALGMLSLLGAGLQGRACRGIGRAGQRLLG